MADHEIAFARGTFLIRVEDQPERGAVAAHLALLDDRHVAHPLAFSDGGLVEIRAPTEARALGAALVYLESRFGAPSDVTHAYAETYEYETVETGSPVVIEPAPQR